MSLEGSANGTVLRGKINTVDVLFIDAYAVAVRNGFKGTEEEWLASLAGNADRAEAANASAEEAATAAVTAKTEAENFALSASYHADQAVQASNSATESAGIASEYALRAEAAVTGAFGDMETALDGIIAIQESLIGGDGV